MGTVGLEGNRNRGLVLQRSLNLVLDIYIIKLIVGPLKSKHVDKKVKRWSRALGLSFLL